MGVGDKCAYKRCEKIVPPVPLTARNRKVIKEHCSAKCRCNAASSRWNDLKRGGPSEKPQTREAMRLIYELRDEVWARCGDGVCIYCERIKVGKLLCADVECLALYNADYKREWRRLGNKEKRDPNNRNPQRKRKQHGKDDNRQDDAW